MASTSHRVVCRDTGLSTRQVERAIKGLRKAGLIIVAYGQFAENGGKLMRTLLVRLDFEDLQRAWEIVVDKILERH